MPTPITKTTSLDVPGLVEVRANSIGGVQRIYRWGDWGLSLINSPMAHSFPFAWEAAVLRFKDRDEWSLDYSTPLTDGVEVFRTEAETVTFIEKARRYFEKSREERQP